MSTHYFAPGRVNLIGEHLDYNGGLVLPAALSMGIRATFTPLTDNRILLRSAGHGFQKEISLTDKLDFDSSNDWANYPLGVMHYLRNEGLALPACEIIYQ